MKISDVVARLRAECPSFATIDHALTAPGDYDYPAAFVAPVKRVAESDRMLGGPHAQMVRQVFGVYVVLPKRTDSGSGGSAADDLDDLCAELRLALVSWTPDPIEDHPIDYAGGELTEREGLACWREDFTSVFDLRV